MKFLILCAVVAFFDLGSGYSYLPPPPTSGGYEYPVPEVKCPECPEVPPIDIERPVFLFQGKQGFYNVTLWKPEETTVRMQNITKNFTLVSEDIEVIPHYKELPVTILFEEPEVKTDEETIDKPVVVGNLKEICQTPVYEPPEIITIYRNRTFVVIIDKIIERPVYNQIFNVTYVDVPVEIEVEQIVERPVYNNITVDKIVEVPNPKYITDNIKNKTVEVPVENVPKTAIFTVIANTTEPVECPAVPQSPDCPPPVSCTRTIVNCACDCTVRNTYLPSSKYLPSRSKLIPSVVVNK